MEAIIRGKAFVVGDNVDTDQIIPAEHLSLDPSIPAERKLFGKYAMSGMPPAAAGLPGGGVKFIGPDGFTSPFTVIIAGRNFGCGSSREHAPLALAEAGVRAVVAQSYARIFYRNSINGAYLAPLETAQRLIEHIATGQEVEIDLAAGVLKELTSGRTWPLQGLGDAGQILQAGGIFEFARKAGMLKAK